MNKFAFVIFLLIEPGLGLENVIWNRRSKTFVPIYDIPKFKKLYDTAFNKSREKENHNFLGEKVHLVYYEEPNIFEFYDNNTKATGICGDIWTILSEHLNFTLTLTKIRAASVGFQPLPNHNFTGILGMMQQNKFTIVPKMEAFSTRYDIVQMTNPLWKDDLRLFIKPYFQFKLTWMLDLFSWKIWALIAVFYIALSFSSYLSQKLTNNYTSYYLMRSLEDNFFYGFGAICNQGDVLYAARNNYKILSFSISLFSWLLITSFNSQLIIHMTQKVLVKPFTNLEELACNTDYTILAAHGSTAYVVFQRSSTEAVQIINSRQRARFFSDIMSMWDLACSKDNKYTVFQNDLQQMDEDSCGLYPIGESFLRTWIVAGIVKNFTYKKSIDIGIMKLNEFGIMNILKIRWLNYKRHRKPPEKYYSPITLQQISLIIGIYIFGLCASIIVVIVEIIVYLHDRK